MMLTGVRNSKCCSQGWETLQSETANAAHRAGRPCSQKQQMLLTGLGDLAVRNSKCSSQGWETLQSETANDAHRAGRPCGQKQQMLLTGLGDLAVRNSKCCSQGWATLQSETANVDPSATVCHACMIILYVNGLQ